MAKTVNIYEAKSHLSQLVERAARGEEIVIARAGKPRARLGPLPAKRLPRRWGLGKGKVWVAANFDEPLPLEIMRGFEGHEG